MALPAGISFEERPNFTRDEVVTVIEDALAMVGQVDPVDDLRVAVFQAAVQMLSNKQIIQVQMQQMPMPAMALPNLKRH